MGKIRKKVPNDIKRSLLVEAGYRCSIPHCNETSALDFHHIDGNPSNNRVENIIVVCTNHHRACTIGRIDRMACKHIKSMLKPKPIGQTAEPLSAQQLKRILRSELTTKKITRVDKLKRCVFPSIFKRHYLFKHLRTPFHASHEQYLALCVLGELRYKGSTKIILDFVKKIKNPSLKKLSKESWPFYRATVEALTKIGTHEAILWLAEELQKSNQDPIVCILLFIALANSKKSEKYAGFKILEQKKVGKGDTTCKKTIFQLSGHKYEIKVLDV